MSNDKIPPTHPGDVLFHDFMEPLEITSYRLAKDIGMTPSAIGLIIKGERAVTAETAHKLARYFKTNDPQAWLNLQAKYDLEMTLSDTFAEKLEAITPVGV